MLSFRQKVFTIYAGILIVFSLTLYPFANHYVQRITIKSLSEQLDRLIEVIHSSPNPETMIQRVKGEKHTTFYRITLFLSDQEILFDSHIPDLISIKDATQYVRNSPELVHALEGRLGWSEHYSTRLEQELIYVARAFKSSGKTYILRTAFSLHLQNSITRNFEIAFLTFSVASLLLFSLMTGSMVHRLSSPIRKIIQMIKPYQDGLVNQLPNIQLSGLHPKDDFNRLANTLNRLSTRVQTQIKSITQERNQRASILEALIEGVIAIDHSQTITYLNTTACKMLGVLSKDYLEQPLSSIDIYDVEELLNNCVQQQKILSTSIQVKQKKGSGKIHLDIVAIPTGTDQGSILVMQDKSLQLGMAAMRKDFVANASHELKTPITIIRGFAETLNENPDLPINTRKDVTQKIVKNCIRMDKLVKDLLLLADLDNLPRSRVSECDLTALIENCQEMILTVYPEANIAIRKKEAEPFLIYGDGSLLELAIINLLDNASKYSIGSPEITVTLSQANNEVSILISDKGIGIPPEDVEHIFQRFYTVDKAHSRKMGGAGLGLSIVEMIIKRHLGSVSISSIQGEGTSFHIKIPNNLNEFI